MKSIEEVNLEKILPSNGPSINEVKKYLEKYSGEKIVIKCGGSVLLDSNLFNQFDGYVLPGGFSYQDRIRAGVIAAKWKINNMVRDIYIYMHVVIINILCKF